MVYSIHVPYFLLMELGNGKGQLADGNWPIEKPNCFEGKEARDNNQW